MAGHVACVCVRTERHTGFWVGDPKERDHLEALVVGGRIILKLILKK
jgi:hypothetical protein